MLTRRLSKSGIEVSAIGLGCWAIGGPLWLVNGANRQPLSWGSVDDKESIRAIHRALDLGVNFFDTADAYGAGHSERILGQAIEGRRDQVVISTKFGSLFEEKSRSWVGHPSGGITSDFVRDACEASLKRLNTDYIDLYMFHWADYDTDLAVDLLPHLDQLVEDGKVRSYGWSTHFAGRARVFAGGQNCVAIQYHYNVLEHNPGLLALCEEFDLASIARAPLAMGLLTGKYVRGTRMPNDDVRHVWDLHYGRQARQLDVLEEIHEILTRDGRTLAQAALGWLWARGFQVIPIPGFKNVKQVEENAGALELGPLSNRQMREIAKVLSEYSEFQGIACTSCGQCMPCPSGVDIPINFELYNRVVNVGVLGWITEEYNVRMTEGQRASACTACQECEERCPQNIGISAWMLRVHETLTSK